MGVRISYDKLTLEKAKTMQWETCAPIQTRLALLPAGTKVRILGKCSGWEIEFGPCLCCGIKVRARKVPHSCLVESL